MFSGSSHPIPIQFLSNPYLRPHRRSSGGERIIEDESVRLWSVYRSQGVAGGDAMIFTCISDSREPSRALAVSPSFDPRDISEDTLRHLLRHAPRLGNLA